MAKNEIYQFYVEGEDEKKVIETLKKDMNSIAAIIFTFTEKKVNQRSVYYYYKAIIL